LFDGVFIVTALGWSYSCVSFEIESTRWHCRSSSICSLCSTIWTMAMKCELGFRAETVALIEFSWIEPS
jgi:hypothetical protein